MLARPAHRSYHVALGATMAGPPSIGPPAQSILPFKDELAPLALVARTAKGVILGSKAITANDIRQGPHPTFFVGRVIGVKVDDLAIVESDAEPLLDKHVTLFLFTKGGPSALPVLAGGLLLSQSPAIVDESLCICEVDGGPRLACGLVVCRQFGAGKLEVAAAPVLRSRQ